MRPDERLEIAHAAYLRALALVRACSTRASWRRALAASRNLASAIRDSDRARAALAVGHWRAPAGRPPGGRPRGGGGALLHAIAAAGRCATPPRPGRGAPRAGDASRRGAAERWPEFAAEVERAHALMEESRLLVAQSRALCAWLAGAGLAGPARQRT
ncbi:MAG TPA: hypothetical protein VFL83_06585 [Anaeromyxobacter sp.]|nr:hypothetical protein [Anaeromyxobacter sp.]